MIFLKNVIAPWYSRLVIDVYVLALQIRLGRKCHAKSFIRDGVEGTRCRRLADWSVQNNS
jgi:hypothetical protein